MKLLATILNKVVLVLEAIDLQNFKQCIEQKRALDEHAKVSDSFNYSKNTGCLSNTFKVTNVNSNDILPMVRILDHCFNFLPLEDEILERFQITRKYYGEAHYHIKFTVENQGEFYFKIHEDRNHCATFLKNNRSISLIAYVDVLKAIFEDIEVIDNIIKDHF